MDLTLVLASASPRRRELLARLGFPLQVVVPGVPERILPGEDPARAAERLAREKAVAVAGAVGDRLVVAADTVVVDDGTPLGKPRTPSEAEAMLRRLRGRWHRVVTGVAVLDVAARRCYLGSVTTWVRMRAYADEELQAYVASGEPMDKAGGYAIQDERFRPVEAVRGCYANVVGLPLCQVVAGLRALGVDLPASAEGSCPAAPPFVRQEEAHPAPVVGTLRTRCQEDEGGA
ncbi:MAG TPA: Maf family protein [Chloroflexota bacterium]